MNTNKTISTLLCLLCILSLFPLTASASKSADGQELLIFYSNNVRGETEPCG